MDANSNTSTTSGVTRNTLLSHTRKSLPRVNPVGIRLTVPASRRIHAFLPSLLCALAAVRLCVQAEAAETTPLPVQRVDPLIQKIISEISEERIAEIFHKLESFGTRNTLSDPSQKDRGIGVARQWILDQFKSFGPRLQVSFDTHNISKGGRVWKDIELRNVVAILPGKIDTNRWIMVAGHYDSLNLKIPQEMRGHPERSAELPAPGVS